MRYLSSRTCVLLPSLACAVVLSSHAAAQTPSWRPVEQQLSRTGIAQPGEVLRFNFPRTDLRVTLDGVQIRPNLVLRSWVSFKRLASGQAMIMGDLVLTDDEINPVISALQQGGVEQTALHNHLVSGSPTTMNLHIGAQGPRQR